MYKLHKLKIPIVKHFSTFEDKIKSIEITENCVKVTNP
jgi:hypothetical protein